MSHSRKKLDLTGQRFGKLTVLEHREPYSLAVPVQLRTGDRSADPPPAQRPRDQLRLQRERAGPPHLRGRHLRGDDPHPDGAQQQHQRSAGG